MDIRFDDKVAIVTGSAGGIGAGIARELGRRGARVALADIAADGMEKVRAEIEAEGSEALAVPTDVTRREQVDAMVARVVETWGRVDVLVNNAGRGTPFQWLEDITDEEWRATMALNLDSAFMVSRAVLPHMKERRYGRIVMITSIDGVSYSDTDGARYTAAKAGMGGLMRQMAFELGRFNITCNAVAPNITMSERVKAKWREQPEEVRRRVLEGTPLGRVAEVEDVALPVVFLASDWARFITGVTLLITGGYYM